jgi:hypothetical protein
MGYDFDIGSQVAVAHGYSLSLTSSTGFTTGSTASMGDPIDLWAIGGNPKSCKSIVSLFNKQVSTSALGYCTVTLKLETADSSNSTAFDAAHTTADSQSVGCTSEAAAANYSEFITQDINLDGAERWIRQVVTIARAATSSFDGVTAEGVLIFGGLSVLPGT